MWPRVSPRCTSPDGGVCQSAAQWIPHPSNKYVLGAGCIVEMEAPTGLEIGDAFNFGAPFAGHVVFSAK